METIFVFRICNHLGKWHQAAIVTQTYEEALEIVKELEYNVKSVKFIGAVAL